MVLAARGWGHGGEFGKASEDRDVTEPDNDISVNQTSCATVDETVGSQEDDSLPGDEDGAGEAENGHETKVTLQRSSS